MPRGLTPRNPKEMFDLVRKLPSYGRLVWALLRDPRVPATHKSLLVLLAGYIVSPIDLIPDFIPVLGQLDDVAVALLAIDRFIASAPQEVVDEHLARIARNEDDLRRDLAQAERVLGTAFERLRDNLERVLTKGGGRFKSAKEAEDGLVRWEDRD